LRDNIKKKARHLLCSIATKQKEEGDDNNAIVAFFIVLQQKKKVHRLLYYAATKKGDGNFVAVGVFATGQQKKEGDYSSVVIFLLC